MNRRLFVSGAAAGLVAQAQTPSPAAVKPGDIPRRTFGKTGEKLSVIGQAGGRFPLAGWEDAKAITWRAYELGVNYFDNAHNYWGGRSEEVYGAALAPVRKQVFITTKSSDYSRQGATAQLELSLRRLKTDYVDLWQIHQVGEMSEVEQIFGPNGSLEAVVAAKKAGKCRFIGFTGHRDPAIHLAMLERFADFDTILMPLHMAEPAYLSFEKQVLPVAVKRGMGIQAMKSTGNSRLLAQFSARQCISYVLSLPVHCLALGCTTMGQIEDDVRIARQFQPYGEPEMLSLRKQAEKLAGPSLEDWKRNTTRAARADDPVYAGG